MCSGGQYKVECVVAVNIRLSECVVAVNIRLSVCVVAVNIRLSAVSYAHLTRSSNKEVEYVLCT